MRIYFAHDGNNDGHPQATTSPSIGMPPSPQFSGTNNTLYTAQSSSSTPMIIPALILVTIACIGAVVYLKLQEHKSSKVSKKEKHSK
jgi:hypothetical protein